MSQVTEYLSDWMRAIAEHAEKVDILKLRIDPVENEVDNLYRILDRLTAETPTWHDYVIDPILDLLSKHYVVKRLNDRTVLQLPVMLISKADGDRGPKSLLVLFRLTDKVTGEFFMEVTGYSPDTPQPVRRKLASTIMLTTELILKTINEVRDAI